MRTSKGRNWFREVREQNEGHTVGKWSTPSHQVSTSALVKSRSHQKAEQEIKVDLKQTGSFSSPGPVLEVGTRE